MKFDSGIATKYRKSIDDAFQTILDKGDEHHRTVMNEIIASKMLVQVKPVGETNASGRTGLVSVLKTNAKMATERLTFREALSQIYIVIAEQTIDTGGQRGCEGTFVHEGQHAYDFAQTLESRSNADMNPLEVFDPTLYELEWEAHKTAGRYMLCVNQPEYIQEGLDLMILAQDPNGKYFVSDDGIRTRLRDGYGLSVDENQGRCASRMLGIIV
jgi:hypothetical protein